MTAENSLPFYPQNLEPLDESAVSDYLSDMPQVETFNLPAEIIKNPDIIKGQLEMVAWRVRRIETDRRGVSGVASALFRVHEQSPETIASLPPHLRQMAEALISRVTVADDIAGQANSEASPFMTGRSIASLPSTEGMDYSAPD